MRYPLLLKLFVLFLFFLPLRFFEIPGSVIGFSLNFSRFFAVVLVMAIGMNIALNARYGNNLFLSGKYRNPYVLLLLIYFLLSILYYYILLSLGQTFLFADGDHFFRSWEGRSFAQLLVFLTYGIIPFFVTKYYAQIPRFRELIERVFTRTTLFIVYYGYLQQLFYQLGLPTTGRTFGDDKILWHGPNDFMIRFNSFAGEPRDLGTFMIGALFFYWYTRSGNVTLWTKVNMVLMFIAFLASVSTSAFVVAILSLLFIVCEKLWRMRIYIRVKHVRTMLISVFLTVAITYVGISSIFVDQFVLDYKDVLFTAISQEPSQRDRVVGQAHDLVLLYYLPDVVVRHPLYLIFGSGYAHFMNPLIVDILKNDLSRVDVFQRGFADTRSYVNKIIVETGIVGLTIYVMMFFYTLKLNNIVLSFFKKIKDKEAYRKAWLLRVTFIVFFISGAVHTSFYYFIIMGMIVGWLNALNKKNEMQESANYASL